MIKKKMICVECPKGCALSVDIENCRIVEVAGNECPKGKTFAASEVENPVRILTSAVLTEGLAIKMCPVRTDKPIPKDKMREAMGLVKRIRINRPVRMGDVIVRGFLGLDVNLISTRDIS